MGAISTYRTEPTARRGNYHVRTLRARLDLGGVSVLASHGGATKIGCDRRRNEEGTFLIVVLRMLMIPGATVLGSFFTTFAFRVNDPRLPDSLLT